MHISSRTCFFAGFIFCFFLIVTAFYFQFRLGLEPCPLCISQRIMVVVVGLVMLAGCINNSTVFKVGIFAALASMMSLLGAGVSARHVYIQHLPANEVPECGPGIAYMFNYLPINETLRAMVTGTGDCAKADWWLLGLSMPAWVLICFLLLFILNLYIYLKRSTLNQLPE